MSPESAVPTKSVQACPDGTELIWVPLLRLERGDSMNTHENECETHGN